MDPYLERYWGDIHTRLVMYAADALQEQLPRDLLARVEENVSLDSEDDFRSAAPDVEIVEQSRPAAGAPTTVTGGLAEPIVVPVYETRTDRHVLIYEAATGNRVVTAIEFLSPSNKTPGKDRERYRRKQRDYLDAGMNLVEVDLVRSGLFTLAVPERNVDQKFRSTYQICVRRITRPDHAEIYPAPIRERLPAIPIPLRPDDADVVLDLQELIDESYRRGRYETIDYSTDPQPPLSPDDARWADEVLQQAGLRN